MKMHTFFLSNKALVIVGGSLAAGGSLLFVSGILVGVRVQAGSVPSRSAQTPAVITTASTRAGVAESRPAASDAAAAPASGGASSPAPVDGAWPFSASGYTPDASAFAAPATTDAAPAPAPAPAVPTAPRADSTRRAPVTGRISLTAYTAAVDAEQPADAAPARAATEETAYLVQVGSFRVEQHAQELVRRLAAAGYRPSITVRQEGDRELHVVRVGGFVGLDKAERAAARIGQSEQLAAAVVVAQRR